MNNYDCEDMRQEEMLCKIKEYQFSIIELGLYLDTHPEDEKALCLFRLPSFFFIGFHIF